MNIEANEPVTTTRAARSARAVAAATKGRTGTRRPVALTNPVHRIRLQNVIDLIKYRFEGNASSMAKAIGKSHTYLWQLLHKERRIGEQTARTMEQKLNLEPGQLDRESGATEVSSILIQHMGDGRTRQYRLVPQADLRDFEAKPKASPEDRRPCPVEECSDSTVWLTYTNSTDPRFAAGTTFFIDRKQRELADHGIYVVKVLKGPLKGRTILREARDSEHGFVLRALVQSEYGDMPQSSVKVLGRAIYSAVEHIV